MNEPSKRNRDPRRKTDFNFLIQTDASVIGGKSVHSFNIRGLSNSGRGGKEIRRKSFSRLFDDSSSAEFYAITEALQFMYGKQFNRSIVLTDNKMIVDMVRNRGNKYENHRFGRDVVYLRSLLDRTNSIIKFQKRSSNKGADAQCRATWEKKRFSIKGKEVKGLHKSRKNKQTTTRKSA